VKRRSSVKRRAEEPDGEIHGAVCGSLAGGELPWTETLWSGEWAPSELDLAAFPSVIEEFPDWRYRYREGPSHYHQRYRATMELKRALLRIRERGGL
jgi:hypothetical protein